MLGEFAGIREGEVCGADGENRFHAWQSSLVFTAVFFVHLIFSWSSALSWILFVGDLALIAWLVFRAYKDGMYLLCYREVTLLMCCSRYSGQT